MKKSMIAQKAHIARHIASMNRRIDYALVKVVLGCVVASLVSIINTLFARHTFDIIKSLFSPRPESENDRELRNPTP